MDFSRRTIRGILLGIILLTIPCYICGIAFWASSPGRDTPRATNTPIDPFGRATNTPIDPFASRTAVSTSDVTSTGIFDEPTTRPGFTPIVPTIQIFPTFTSIPPTSIPPTNVPPTNVPPTSIPPTAIPPTVPPTNTQEILVPPTDTPAAP